MGLKSNRARGVNVFFRSAHKGLERDLRANRPEPSDGFVRLAAGKIEIESSRQSGRRHVWQPLAMLAAGAALVAFLLAFGNFSGVASSVRGGGQPFAAANVVYAAPTITCGIGPGNGNHVGVTGNTSLHQGSVSIVITASPSDTGYPVTLTAPVNTTTGDFTVSTSGTSQRTSGVTYTATVTQTESGYATGSTTCSFTA